jgi:hypothetical protein
MSSLIRRPGLRRPRPVASAVLAAALYVASAVVVPLVHARTEVLSSRAEVEAQHSAQCPRIHAEAAGLGCSTFQFAPPQSQASLTEAAARRAQSAPSGEPQPRFRDQQRQHLVRAPPGSR